MATEDIAITLEPALDRVHDVVDATPGTFQELGLGMVVLIVVITFHGWAMARVNATFNRELIRLGDHTPEWRYSLLTAVGIALLTATHMIETLIWSVPILGFGILGNMRDAYYFVMESYTTLGASAIKLPEAWRLLGPVIAISGLFTFSWTGSVLVYIVTETARHQRDVGKKRAKAASNSPSPPDKGKSD
ncbi:hypothetical protein [Neotabrizicola shimadae]|uniref:Two pore domain potassium channel family protein n=1 Tax=Neotabrizicola shimadae TaxID=2807096 RepID=A0A8G0ZXM4_9RHOB|nr:hypothetical protein [Neotabrizicola shimadae]QYZ69939.1 hypothetical protein JO391_20015 [Neotabrizicola shimadae]